MAIFRSKSSTKKYEGGDISAQDQANFKIHTGNVHDPILSAVNEAQPFEQAADHSKDNRRPSYLSEGSSDFKDVFGTQIAQPDISNPTRARNERPLDTIRSFEYAITGDLTYRDQLETPRLGWGFHEDFSYYNLAGDRTDQLGETGYDRPVINFNTGGEQGVYQAGNYSATSLRPEGKKKRGLFGRKKK